MITLLSGYFLFYSTVCQYYNRIRLYNKMHRLCELRKIKTMLAPTWRRRSVPYYHKWRDNRGV